jgi:VanZ family protein
MNNLKKRKLFRTIFIIWSLILFTLTSYPKLSVPSVHIVSFDKLAHAFVYLIFAWLFMLMHDQLNLTRVVKRLMLLAAIIPLTDELHQIPIPGRFFSIWDIVADLIGFSIIILIYRKKATNRLLSS